MLTRRNMIIAITAGGAWFGRSIKSYGVHGDPTPRYDALVALCLELSCPRKLGDACIGALSPPEISSERLLEKILASLPKCAGNCRTASSLRPFVRDLVRDDFRRNNTVVVNGWIFSLTETRIYAFASSLENTETTIPESRGRARASPCIRETDRGQSGF